MPLTRLLLVAADSRKYILGEKGDKLCIRPASEQKLEATKANASERDSYHGEIVLCFQLDDPKDEKKRVPRILEIGDHDSRCDGLIFYKKDGQDDTVICLVEMKSKSDVKDAVIQIKATGDKIKYLIHKECDSNPTSLKQLGHIKWKACIFHHGSAPNNAINEYSEDLKKRGGFCDYKVFDSRQSQNDPDAGPFVRGKETAENATKKFKNKYKIR